MRTKWRDLPEKRTARQLVHAVRGGIEEFRGHMADLDEPTTNKGALALEAMPAVVELAYQTTFSATEKLTQMEVEAAEHDKTIKQMEREHKEALSKLRAEKLGAERRAQRADKALSQARKAGY